MDQSKPKKKKEKKSLFAPLAPARSSQRVAAAILRVIVEGSIKPGENLPPERTLATQFQVTRNTVREALRSLEQLRLLSIRQGSGIEVRDYLAHAGLEFVSLLFESSDDNIDRWMEDVAEVRAVLGRAIIGFALENFDLQVLPLLKKLVDQFEEEAQKPDKNIRKLQSIEIEIHNMLIRGSGNRAMILLHNSIWHIYERVSQHFEQFMSQPEHIAMLYQRLVSALESEETHVAKALIETYFQTNPTTKKVDP